MMTAKPILQHRRRQRAISWQQRLLWLEPLWLLLLAPSVLFTDYFWEPALRPLFIMALFAFWPLHLKTGQRLLPAGAAGWCLGFLLLWLPITMWHTSDSNVSWAVAGYIYFALATFVALSHWPPLRRQPHWLVLLLLVGGMGLAIIGPEAFSVNPDKWLDVYGRTEFPQAQATGSPETINPNILAGALVMLIPLGLALALRGAPIRRRWWALLWWAPVLLMTNAVVLSQSRGSWLALVAAVFLLGWLFWPRFFTVLLIIAVLIGAAAWWQSSAHHVLDHDLAHSAQASLLRRLGIWRLSLQMVAEQPLTGIGLGTYEQAFTARFPNLPLIGGRLAPPHAHNLFVQVALDLGIPGLLAYLCLLAALVRSLLSHIQHTKKIHHHRTYPLACGVLSGLAAMVVVGSFDNALWGTKLLIIPWCLLALAQLLGDLENPNVLTH